MSAVKFLSFYLSNPYRIVQQLQYKKFLKNNPGVPWMAPDVIHFLDKNISSNFHILEWGSGGSTQWFANRCHKITSIENNAGWYDKVKNDIKDQSLENVDYKLIETQEDIDQKEMIGSGEIPPYVNIISTFQENSLDLVIVDGSFRHMCIKEAPKYIKPGGYLLLDNSNWCSYDDWGIPEGWEIVAHHNVGVSCTTIWQKPIKSQKNVA